MAITYIWVLGHTKSGKSTHALKLTQAHPSAVVYEAGAWARKLYEQKTGVAVTSTNDSDPALRAQMTAFAMEALSLNANVSVEAFESWNASQDTTIRILTGIRNPYDFFHILSSTPKDIHQFEILKGTAQDTFEKGVDVIVGYLESGVVPEKYAEFSNKVGTDVKHTCTYIDGFQKDNI